MTLAAYGLTTGGHRYLGSELEDPLAVLDCVITDWYFAGWDSADIISSRISTEFGIVGGTIPGNLTIQAPIVSIEFGEVGGAITGVDYTHVFGLKTGGDRYPYSQLEDPNAVLDVVLTNWYLVAWDIARTGAVKSTEYGVVAGSSNVTIQAAMISTEFGTIGGSFSTGITILGAIISTAFQIKVIALNANPIYVTITEEVEDIVCDIDDGG